VQAGTEPPASRYPKIADGSLVPIAKLAFPAIAGVEVPTSAAEGCDLDFGPNWRAGILSKQPPAEVHAYPTLVPQVDADGNELGGVRLPEIVAPLATYTGWNLRSPSIGAPTERISFLGSFIPLQKTGAEAEAAHDPRRPIQSRFKDYEAYHALFEKALDGLIHERYILAEDRQSADRAKVEWDWAMEADR
jgi:hypothetical protein